VVIDLSRNFGQHKAMMTGMDHARGEYVFLIEIDLEEQPEWVVGFHEILIKEQDVDVVYGVQGKRKGGFFERLWGSLFYKAFNLLAQFKMPKNHVTARLMTRRYVDALLMHRDRILFLGGVYEQVGFRQIPHLVEKLSHSKTTYTAGKKLLLAVNSMVSFSTAPLFAMFWFGLAVFFFSMAIFAWVLYRWWAESITPGWTSVFASIWLVGGILMLSLGVIGIYLKKVIEEVKEQPYTIIRKVYRNS
jgi:putative glycosyltransferase